MTQLVFAFPSKGRLMEQAAAHFETRGLHIRRLGAPRGYRGQLVGIEGIEIAFLSASEIAQNLGDGKVDIGLTGEDLFAECRASTAAEILLHLPYGAADVVTAVPEAWLDVADMADLDEVSEHFYERHGRRLRVATKYPVMTRKFFAEKGVTGYRIVESLGATEAAPAAGLAEVIVDITSTGETLKANRLKVLDDGVILKSSAVVAVQHKWRLDPRVAHLLHNLGLDFLKN